MLENNMLTFSEGTTSGERSVLASISFAPYSIPDLQRSYPYGNDLRFNFANGEFVEGVATDVDFLDYMGLSER